MPRRPRCSLLGGELGFAFATLVEIAEPSRPSRLFGGLFLTLALFLAVDAERRHGTRHQPPEGDRFSAVLADVDLVGIQADQLFVDFPEQELLDRKSVV